MAKIVVKSIGFLAFLGLSLCLAAGASAQWGDALKKAGEAEAKRAASPATDKAREVSDKADQAKAKADQARDAKDEAAAKVDAAREGSLSETAKRAGGKGVSTAADTYVGGTGATGAAKKGGAAAVNEAIRTPDVAAPGKEMATD